MYYFLTSANGLQLPVIEPSPVGRHVPGTGSFLDKLRKNYGMFAPRIGDPKEFEKQVDAFRWFAERMPDRKEAEFFFSVRVYDAFVHPEFEEPRQLWVKIGRDLLLDDHAIRSLRLNSEDFISVATQRLTDYLYTRASLVPPGLMPFEVAFSFAAQLEEEYFGDEIHDVLERKLKEANLAGTAFARNVLEVFRKNIPLITLINLIDAATEDPDGEFELCRVLFFDHIKNTYSRFRYLTFGEIWSNNDHVAIQVLKGKFIELLAVVFKTADLTEPILVSIIQTHLELFRLGERNTRHFLHTYFIEALRSEFPFSGLGDQTISLIKETRGAFQSQSSGFDFGLSKHRP